jgi:ATP-dependent RNA helicase DDX6/DHH1
MVLVPTRELALQVSALIKDLGKHMDVQCMVSTGGTSVREDVLRLYGTVHVLVGTPGRIRDLASRGIANVSNVTYVAVDEVRPACVPTPLQC